MGGLVQERLFSCDIYNEALKMSGSEWTGEGGKEGESGKHQVQSSPRFPWTGHIRT